LMATFSSARFAYIRLSFAFSASNSFIRRRSATVAPAYFDFQLKYVARLMPCFRTRSASRTPASPSLRMLTTENASVGRSACEQVALVLSRDALYSSAPT
jgi:hypothetical protein